MPFRFSLPLLSLLLALVSTPASAAADQNARVEIRFGSVAMDVPAVMHQRLKPLTDYLSRELQRPVTLHLSPDLSKAAAEVAAGNVEISYMTPFAYIKAQRTGGVRLAAKMVTKGQSSFKLMLVVRADSPIQSVADLAGKSFAFGDKAAILQRAVVVGAGMPLERLGSYKFIGHYDNIARGVANGDFDAGILKDTSAYQWEKKGLRILYASPDLPPYNMVVSRNVEDPLYEAIRRALLQLDPQRPDHLKIIQALDPTYDGFVATSDAEYDVVRQLIKPFEK
jgi:phosphonate transport system substrate-binding protein